MLVGTGKAALRGGAFGNDPAQCQQCWGAPEARLLPPVHAEGLGLPIFLLFWRSWKSLVWVWALLDVQGWAVWPLLVTARPQQPPHHMPGEDTDSARLAGISRAHWPCSASFADFLLPLLQAPLMTGQPGPGHGKKLGHRGVDASGETTYKKVPFCPLLVGGDSQPSRGPHTGSGMLRARVQLEADALGTGPSSQAPGPCCLSRISQASPAALSEPPAPPGLPACWGKGEMHFFLPPESEAELMGSPWDARPGGAQGAFLTEQPAERS